MKNIILLLLIFTLSSYTAVAQGVELVEDITIGEGNTFSSGNGGIIGVISGKIYSYSKAGATNRIWATNPVDNETSLIYEHGHFGFLTIFNDELYFQAWDDNGSQLIVIHADQTNEELFTTEEYIEDFTVFDGSLYFSDDNFLMKYNEADGVSLVYEFYNFGGILDMAATEEQLFILGSIDGSRQLFTSDGTTEGTSYYYLMNEGNEFNTLTFMTAVGNKVFFWFGQNDDTYRLWVTDGTEAGTLALLAHNQIHFTNLKGEGSIIVYDGKLYYRGDTDEHGDDLYVSDGTLAGTKLFFEPYDGTSDSQPQYMFVHNDELYFKIRDSSWIPRWFKTAGIEGEVERFLQGYAFVNTPMNIYNGSFLFAGSGPDDHWRDRDVHVSDGTLGGTTAITFLSSSEYNFEPSDLTIVEDKIFFIGQSEIYGGELFVFDPNLVGLRNEIRLNDLEMTVYPTVTSQQITVLLEQQQSTGFQVELYRIDGQLVLQEVFTGSAKARVSLSNLAAGTYLLKVQDEDNRVGIKRIIKM